jgi:hypothetical protein
MHRHAERVGFRGYGRRQTTYSYFQNNGNIAQDLGQVKFLINGESASPGPNTFLKKSLLCTTFLWIWKTAY